jgi:hypothetical protein
MRPAEPGEFRPTHRPDPIKLITRTPLLLADVPIKKYPALILIQDHDPGPFRIDPILLDRARDQDREQPRGPARLVPEPEQVIRGVKVWARPV